MAQGTHEVFSRVRVDGGKGLGQETLTGWQWMGAKETRELSGLFRWALFYFIFLKLLD